MINPQRLPLPVRVTPLVAWSVVLIVFSVSSFLWLISEPIVHIIYTSLYGMIPSEAVGPADVMKYEFYAILIIINLLFVLWAFLVTTRRQPVTTPGQAYPY